MQCRLTDLDLFRSLSGSVTTLANDAVRLRCSCNPDCSNARKVPSSKKIQLQILNKIENDRSVSHYRPYSFILIRKQYGCMKNYRRYRRHRRYSLSKKWNLEGSWSVVRGAQIQAFTFSSQDHGRLPDVWCGVLCVVCGVGGVLCWCWCLVVVVVLCGYCVVLWCGVVWCGVYFCVFLCFFFFLFFSQFSSFSFLLSLSFFLLSSFLLLSSLLSSLLFLCFFSLLFSPPNTVERTDQPTRRPTSRHLNVIWRTAGAPQSVLSLLLSPCSSLLSLPSSKKKEGTFNYMNISGEGIIFYYSF